MVLRSRRKKGLEIMTPATTTILVLFVVLISAVGVCISPLFQRWLDQKLTDRKRKRAHAGKVTCEDHEECNSIATWITPNGYFCDWHHEPQMIRYRPDGAREEWAHVLNHAVRRG